VDGETPPISYYDWYFPNIPNSGTPDTGDGRIAVELFNDHTQYTESFWADQLALQMTNPSNVQSSGDLNGVPTSWAFQYQLTTPYGSSVDLQITVYADLNGLALPNAKEIAMHIAGLVEAAAFR
jgi:hypothetical protein